MHTPENDCFIGYDPGSPQGDFAVYTIARNVDGILIIEAVGVAANDNF